MDCGSSDSESYLKWATQLLSSLPDVEGRVFLVDNPILPTDEQIDSAVAGTDWEHREVPVIARSDLAQVIADHSPDIVLGAATGPIVAQVFLTAHTRTDRCTAYSISCDAVGVTTGISAAERAETGRVLAAADPNPAAISRPGHVFPLIAKGGGVRERPGHTEAGVEFAQLAGAQPVAMIAEVVHDDGSMMRFDAVRDFADAHDLVMVSIEQLIAYLDERDAGESSVQSTAEVPLPSEHGSLRARAFTIDGHDHLGVFAGSIDAADDGPAPLVRVHSECLTGDVFGSHRCDCGEQLDRALDLIGEQGGAVLYLTGHEGRGIGLSNKLRAYALQDQGWDTVDANRELGFTDDARDYRAAALILRSLGLTRIRLLTNNPAKTAALEELGVTVESVVPLEIAARPENTHYLATKRQRMHHALTLPEVTGTAHDGAGSAGAVAS